MMRQTLAHAAAGRQATSPCSNVAVEGPFRLIQCRIALSSGGDAMAGTKKVAVVTGANRGIGFETCRQLAKHGMKVVLTSRDREKGSAAAARLRSEGLDVDFLPLDVSHDASVQEFARQIRTTYGRVDVLVNNAGIMIDGKTRDTAA